jgi:hypothetical protein
MQGVTLALLMQKVSEYGNGLITGWSPATWIRDYDRTATPVHGCVMRLGRADVDSNAVETCNLAELTAETNWQQ